MTGLRPIQAVVFDAAGTLIRTREPVGATYGRMARAYGAEVPASRLDEAFGRIFAAAPPNVHPGETLADSAELERRWWRARVRETFRAADGMAAFSDFDAFFDRLWDHYACAEAWELMPGAREALDELVERRLMLAVLSNFDQRLRPLLRQLGIHHLFEAVTLPSDAGAAKPARQIFDVCLKRLGIANHRCVYVGDRAEEDLASSRTAGLHPIDVRQLATLAELPALVEALEKELA
ncbi:MAG: hydrolase [Deltaproteobacteria bacterium]|jgi:putative hydrolase of the HAD superfamily|nr:hydrolase [Deltaproteobacteria bacterium]